MQSQNPVCVTAAGVTVVLSAPHPLKINRPFEPFIDGKGESVWHVELVPVEHLPELEGPPAASLMEYMVFRHDRTFVYRYHDHCNQDKPYAVTEMNVPKKQVTVSFLPQSRNFVSEVQNTFFHIRWDQILLKEGRLILHASLVETEYGGILFTGPSGIGKSTQANLWVQHQNAVQINGDRPILACRNGIWYGCGSPYAGSSECYVNRSCPIRAIVRLERTGQNQLIRLGAVQAFRELYPQMTIAAWDSNCVDRVCDLTTDLATSVPVYKMSCAPDESAVQMLRKELEKEGTLHGK